MQYKNTIADHWGKGDVYALIMSALEKAGKSPGALTVADLAPVDHFHARGFPATVELADRLPSNLTTVFSISVAALVAPPVISRCAFSAGSAVSTSLPPLSKRPTSLPHCLVWIAGSPLNRETASVCHIQTVFSTVPTLNTSP